MQMIRLPDFVGVSAAGTASMKIPKLAATLCRIVLRLGGTAFTKAMIQDIKFKVGSRTVWNVQVQGATTGGTHLDRMNTYLGLYADAYHLTIDFTDQKFKNIAATEIGGYDMSKFAEDCYLEVQIAGATAPTLYAYGFYTPPQDPNDDPMQLVQKLLPVPFSSAAGGRYNLPFEPRGCLIKRAFIMFNGTTGTATADGNISKIEVKKNNLTLFDPQDVDLRFVQQEYGRAPQAQMMVMDYTFDNNLSGALPTANAAALDHIMTLTATETGIAYFQVLDTPFNL